MPKHDEDMTQAEGDILGDAPAAEANAQKSADQAPPTALEAAQAEIQALKDRNLRLLAESQNAAKRAARERDEALRYAEFNFARDLLVVIDDFERTLETTKDKPELQAVAEGVRIIYEHFLKVLAQRGIKQIEAVGKPFDPSFHEALLQQPSAEHAAGTVMQELARGYIMHERVLRPTRVIVSSGPPAA